MYGITYSRSVIQIRRTKEFDAWLDALRDLTAQAKILQRLQQAEKGNLGDHKRFSGLLELRISYGPGYRIYCVQKGAILIIVLGGGTKASQDWDIKRALKRIKDF